MIAADRCSEQMRLPVDQTDSDGHLRVPEESALTRVWVCLMMSYFTGQEITNLLHYDCSRVNRLWVCSVNSDRGSTVCAIRFLDWFESSSTQSSFWELIEFRTDSTGNKNASKIIKKFIAVALTNCLSNESNCTWWNRSLITWYHAGNISN